MDPGRLHRLANMASRAQSVLDLYVEAMATVKEMLKADAVAILEVDEGAAVRFGAWDGLSEDYRGLAASYAPWSLDAEDPTLVVVRDVREDAVGLERPELLAEGIRALAYVPLLGEGQAVGALAAYWRARRELSAPELQVAQLAAQQVAFGVHRIRMAAILRQLRDRERAASEDARRARERMEDATQATREWLAILGHELRNPLNALLNAAQVVERPGTPDAMRTLASAIVRRQVGYLSRLLDGLLDETRISRGLVALRREPIDLRITARLAVEDLSHRLAARSQDFHLSLSDEPVVVSGDATRLRQVVGNLLDNAIKYTPVGGQVGVDVDARGDHALVRVSDSGSGIAPDRLEAVFQPFVQGQQDLARSDGGLGLGLSLVKRIVELHGGRVWAESPGPGRGAVFTVQIPKAAPEVGAA